MENRRIVVAGGSGFIGQAICEYFQKDNEITVLSRNQAHENSNASMIGSMSKCSGNPIRYLQWDGRNPGPWTTALDGADVLINLTGRSVNCRYHYRNMKEIFDSRLKATRLLAKTIQTLPHPPRLWINAASATIYRNARDYPQDDYYGEISSLQAMNMPSGTLQDLRAFLRRWIGWSMPFLFASRKKKLANDFSVRVCQEWEKAFAEIKCRQTRKICLRIAITLGQGGVLKPYRNLVKWWLGGRQGHGKQMFSWVHVEDLCRLIEWLDQHPEVEGTLNCSSPEPVTNRQFMQTLRKVYGYRFGLPAPKWMLELGAKMIGTEPELLLKSRWVVPAKLLDAGFNFKYENLETALGKIRDEWKSPRAG